MTGSYQHICRTANKYWSEGPVIAANHAILIRDSKDRAGRTLTIPASAWQSFANSLK
jgi:hypothetical protein